MFLEVPTGTTGGNSLKSDTITWNGVGNMARLCPEMSLEWLREVKVLGLLGRRGKEKSRANCFMILPQEDDGLGTTNL